MQHAANDERLRCRHRRMPLAEQVDHDATRLMHKLALERRRRRRELCARARDTKA